jgi:hypothetical protein
MRAAERTEYEDRPGATPGPDGRTATLDRTPDGSTSDAHKENMPLLPADRTSSFTERWEQSQRSFVDDPRTSVQEADELVADVIKQLASQFAEERSRLEGQWSRGEDVSTEDLRLALQRYRSFFNRLLKV